MSSSSDWMERIECKLDEDPRLIAGACVIVAHVARRAGFPTPAASDLVAAASAACKAEFQALGAANGAASIKLAVTEFPDRIQVTVEPSGKGAKSPVASLGTGQVGDVASAIRRTLQSAALDGVDVEVRDGIPRVKLVKNSGAAKRRFVF